MNMRTYRGHGLGATVRFSSLGRLASASFINVSTTARMWNASEDCARTQETAPTISNRGVLGIAHVLALFQMFLVACLFFCTPQHNVGHRMAILL